MRLWIPLGISVGVAILVGPACIFATRGTDEIAAPTNPGGQAAESWRLVQSGTPLEVKVERSETNGDISFKFVSNDKVAEEEIYHFDDLAFSVKKIAGIELNPPIVLLTYPRSPLVWNSTGKMVYGQDTFPYEAAVSLSAEDLNVPGGPYSTVKATVNLAWTDMQKKSAERRLEFWFSNGRGIVKREVENVSMRDPSAQKTQEQK
ncbi:MAG: hypothetical protein JST40_05115 [Armatimonadetes bacterium]|nr:hypothetical protein [Armatimonadota bacterium]